jgi:hypothetical protein
LTKDGSIQGESPRQENNMMTAEECAHYIYDATVKRRRTLVLTTQGKLTVFMNKWFPGLADKVIFNILSRERDSPF